MSRLSRNGFAPHESERVRGAFCSYGTADSSSSSLNIAESGSATIDVTPFKFIFRVSQASR